MEFLELAAKRYSVRKFDSRPIPAELMDKVLQAGHLAPTAVNYQPQKVYVLQSPEAMEKIKTCTPCHFDAPALLIVGHDATRGWKRSLDCKDGGEIDACIVATHMILEAAEIGLGTTWVMYFDPAKVKEVFALPENIMPTCLIPIGFPAEDAAPSEMHSKFRDPKEIVEYL